MRQHCNRTVVSINEVASRRAADLREATGGGGTRTLLRHGKGEGGERGGRGGTPSGSRRGLEKAGGIVFCTAVRRGAMGLQAPQR